MFEMRAAAALRQVPGSKCGVMMSIDLAEPFANLSSPICVSGSSYEFAQNQTTSRHCSVVGKPTYIRSWDSSCFSKKFHMDSETIDVLAKDIRVKHLLLELGDN